MTREREIIRVIGYVGRATADRRTLTSIWVRDTPLPVLAYRADRGHDANETIGVAQRVRFETDGRIVAEMHLAQSEPNDLWPVLDLDGGNVQFHRGRLYMTGEIRGVTYTPEPAWPKLKEEPR